MSQDILSNFNADSREVTDAKIQAMRDAKLDTTQIEKQVAVLRQQDAAYKAQLKADSLAQQSAGKETYGYAHSTPGNMVSGASVEYPGGSKKMAGASFLDNLLGTANAAENEGNYVQYDWEGEYRESEKKVGYFQSLVQNSIAEASKKMNDNYSKVETEKSFTEEPNITDYSDYKITKFGLSAGFSAIKQVVMGSGIVEFGKDTWSQSSGLQKALYMGIGLPVGLAIMNEAVEVKCDYKKSEDESLPISVKGQSVEIGNSSEFGKYFKANLNIEVTKNSVKPTKDDYSDGFVINLGVDTSNNEVKVSGGVKKSVVINDNVSASGGFNYLQNAKGTNYSLVMTGGLNGKLYESNWNVGFTKEISNMNVRREKNRNYLFFGVKVPISLGN
ncbi:MAG TPA: hypothetical protein PLB65_08430 [Candidatus Cloacimonas sp.]|nr:hypothetical protein [Candidatus Cloacimonas sp.]